MHGSGPCPKATGASLSTIRHTARSASLQGIGYGFGISKHEGGRRIPTTPLIGQAFGQVDVSGHSESSVSPESDRECKL